MSPPTEPERLATIEQVLRDIREDVHELHEEQRRDHHRLRAVEGSVALLVDEQAKARDRRDYEMRRLGIKVQWMTLGVAFGSFALGVVVALLAH